MIKLSDNSLYFNNSIPIKYNPTINRHSRSVQNLDFYSKKNIEKLSNSTYSLSNNFYHKKKIDKEKPSKKPDLSDPRTIELELTPNAKIAIKTLLAPVASISYVLQEASIAFNKLVSATVTFLVFNLLNVFLSASFSSYEIKLPILTVCLIGSILGARNLVKSTKKIVVSIPKGVKTCCLNISQENCSIFDFICGKDRQHKKSFIKRIFTKISS